MAKQMISDDTLPLTTMDASLAWSHRLRRQQPTNVQRDVEKVPFMAVPTTVNEGTPTEHTIIAAVTLTGHRYKLTFTKNPLGNVICHRAEIHV